MAQNKGKDHTLMSDSGLSTDQDCILFITKNINCFGFSLYKEFVKDGKNVFLSPFSISTALAMLLNGAQENTAKEIRRVLHFETSGIDNAEVNNGFNQLLTSYTEEAEVCTVAFGNALLLQKDLVILSEYKERMKNVYHSLVREVDFFSDNKKVVEEVNIWICENTKSMIKSIFDSLDPSTVMLIINAIYFKGFWKHKFDSRVTHEQLFYNEGDKRKQKNVPMMYLEKKFRYVKKDSYKALELPYDNDDKMMLILLPNELDGLESLENRFDVDFLNDIMSSLYSTDVEVTIPKFHLEFQKELKEPLMNLGMNSAFQSNANFLGMVETDRVKVSEVMHKCVLDVTEEGSEAAAVTAIAVMLCSFSFKEQFIVDHPFSFLIYDKQKKMILFMGRVLEF